MTQTIGVCKISLVVYLGVITVIILHNNILVPHPGCLPASAGPSHRCLPPRPAPSAWPRPASHRFRGPPPGGATGRRARAPTQQRVSRTLHQSEREAHHGRRGGWGGGWEVVSGVGGVWGGGVWGWRWRVSGVNGGGVEGCLEWQWGVFGGGVSGVGMGGIWGGGCLG